MGSKLIVGAFGDQPGVGILVSSDTGRIWVNKLAVDAASFAQFGSYLFAGTSEHGIFVSSDTGETWSNVALIDTAITALAVSGNYLVAGTRWGNIFRFDISDLIAKSSITDKLIERATLFVYPNPFSQSSTISFTSETAGYADVSIVNPSGTEVARLFSGELAPGEHQFSWSNPAAPDGMYECTVRMNGLVEKAGIVRMR